MAETTALGAALAAGCAKGIDLFDLDKEERMASDVFEPKINEDGKLSVPYVNQFKNNLKNT